MNVRKTMVTASALGIQSPFNYFFDNEVKDKVAFY